MGADRIEPQFGQGLFGEATPARRDISCVFWPGNQNFLGSFWGCMDLGAGEGSDLCKPTDVTRKELLFMRGPRCRFMVRLHVVSLPGHPQVKGPATT